MAMTEKQGGSDVRTNRTTATRSGDDRYSVTGHKWFCSGPMSDAFLVLAQAPGGLSCLLVPRVLDDGSRNVLFGTTLVDQPAMTAVVPDLALESEAATITRTKRWNVWAAMATRKPSPSLADTANSRFWRSGRGPAT